MTTTSPRFPRLELHSGVRAPRFEVRSRAHLRAFALVAFCAALTYGFLSQVWNGPTQQEIDSYACNPQVERCA
jgi:hypothetical protein